MILDPLSLELDCCRVTDTNTLYSLDNRRLWCLKAYQQQLVDAGS